jgi:hypothetical protein
MRNQLIVAALSGILLVTLPSVNQAAEPRDVTITVRVTDNLSGPYLLQIAEDKSNPPPPIPYVEETVIRTSANVLYVRVQDRALNWSPWVETVVGNPAVVTEPTPTPTSSTPPPPPPPPPPIIIAPPVSQVTPTSTTSPSASPTSAPTPVSSPTPTFTPTPTTSPTSSPSPNSSTGSNPSPTPVITLKPTATPSPSSTANDAQSDQVVDSLIDVKAKVARTIQALGIALPEEQADLELSLPAGNSKIRIKRNQALAIELPSIARGTTIAISLIVEGKRQSLGSATTSKRGEVRLTTLSFSKVGTYQVEVRVKDAIRRLAITVVR